MKQLMGVTLIAAFTAQAALGQSFNIDLDVGFGDPGIGNGAPSSSFGGAAGQPGYWNRIGFLNGVSYNLDDIEGQSTSASMELELTNLSGGGGFLFSGNTGDFALLLNDAKQVGPLVDGGTLTYTFRGFFPGVYDIYTYAVPTSGVQVDTPVVVPEAIEQNLQVVTGPMPGNAFEYLVTHSVHHVFLEEKGIFHVSITQPPNLPFAMHINGFQVVAVPEASSAVTLSFGAAILLYRRVNLGRIGKEK